MQVRRINRIGYNQKKRVAAYCRVSTDREDQEESYERQMEYYTELIKNNPEWEFAGIYADHGISGTSATKRPEFMRMMEDATSQPKKIDIILVKSISRFSRNIVDCDRAVKALKAADVEVRFEKENLSTFDATSGFIFSVLAAVAQDESRSISENVRWRYANRYKNGEYNMGNNRILGYDCVDGKLVPNDKAPIIRRVFEMFVQGKALSEITETLKDEGIQSMRSDKPMGVPAIYWILQNETYVGDKLLYKTTPINFLTKRPDYNIGYTSYYLTDDHEAIVDRNTWDKAQKRLKLRCEEKKQGIYKKAGQVPLYGKLFCGNCGAPYRRRTLRECQARGGGQYKAWNCREREQGKNGNGCKNRIIRENLLLDELSKKLKKTVTLENLDAALKDLERINVYDEGIEVVYN